MSVCRHAAAITLLCRLLLPLDAARCFSRRHIFSPLIRYAIIATLDALSAAVAA